MRNGCLTTAVALCLAPAAAGLTHDERAAVEEFVSKWEHFEARKYHRAQPRPPSRKETLAVMPHLPPALKADDALLRARTARVLGWMYPASDGMAKTLVDALGDTDADVRAAAAVSLGRFLPDAGLVSPALAVTLQDRQADARCEAALSLGHLGPAAAAALPALEKAARSDPDHCVRACAIEATVRIDRGRSLPLIAEGLRSPVTEVRMASTWSIRWLAEETLQEGRFAAVLAGAVKDDAADHRLRSVAFETMGAVYRDRPEALEAVAAALSAKKVKSPDRGFLDRWSARYRPWRSRHGTDLAYAGLRAVEEWDLFPEQVTELLRPHLAGQHRLQTSLVRVLTEKGIVDGSLAEHLASRLASAEQDAERVSAVLALTKSPIPKTRLAELVAAHAERGLVPAIKALGDCGSDARPQLPLLGRLARNPNPCVATAALEAIAQIGDCPRELLPFLIEVVGRPDKLSYQHRLREAAARALARAEEGVRRLLFLTDERRPRSVREMAVRGLGGAGPEGAIAVPVLIKLNLGGMPMEVVARRALVELGATAGPLLAEELHSEDPRRVCKAAIVLKGIGSEAAPWVSDLFHSWHRWAESYGGARGDAARFTGKAIMSVGEAAVPALVQAIRNDKGKRGEQAAGLLQSMDRGVLSRHVADIEAIAREFPDRRHLDVALVKAYAELPGGRPRVLAFMRDADGRVRSQACSLRRIKGWHGEDVVSALAEAARLGTHGACRDLEELGPSARASLPALMAVAREGTRYSPSAFRAVAAIATTEESLPLLKEALARDDSAMAGARAAERIPSAGGTGLVADLRAALDRELAKEKPNGSLLDSLLALLGRFSPEPNEHVALCREVAADARPHVSRTGSRALDAAQERSAHTVASLSARISSIVHGGFWGRRSRDALAVVRELAALKDRRAVPALLLAATYGPSEDVRSAARGLIGVGTPLQE